MIKILSCSLLVIARTTSKYGSEDPYLFDDVTNELFGILVNTGDQESD